MKQFALRADQIKPLAQGRGGCIATDEITVKGRPVGYMVRDPSDRPHDSGWCFMAGDESQEYLDQPEHHGFYNVNTVANYSPDIVPFLDSPPCTAFARDPVSGLLVEVPYEQPLD